MKVTLARFGLVVCALAAACAEASGDATGGGFTPAGKQASEPAVFVPPIVDAGVVDCGEGTTWTSIYTDIFGAVGKPGSCLFNSSCHGGEDQEGTKGSAVMCGDKDSCRQTFIKQLLVRDSNAANPEKANLFFIIRTRNADGRVGGIMPKEPGDYVYPEACLTRIKGWIANGIPND